MQLLGFACIRDCSICPFACNRDFGVKVNINNNQIKQNLPKAMNEPTEKKSQITEVSEDVPTETKVEIKESVKNLPVLAEVQYEIKESAKKGLFGWRKNK